MEGNIYDHNANVLNMPVEYRREENMSEKARLSIIVIMAVVMITSLVGCAVAFPVTVTDGMGSEVTIKEKPQRIVSLIPSNTEILFAVGAGDTVVGVTEFDDYPPEVAGIAKVGGYATISPEKILDLKPDMVLAYSANDPEVIGRLRTLGLTVVVVDSSKFTDITRNIRLVGHITGNDEKANALAAYMDAKVEEVRKRSMDTPEQDRIRVLYMVSLDPVYVAGTDSYPSDLIYIAGGRNIIEKDGWLQVSLEYLVDRDPQIILCSGMGGRGQNISEQLKKSSVMATTDAVKNGRVYVISDNNFIERPGPRITKGLDEIYSHIAPMTNAAQAPVKPSTPVQESEDAGWLRTYVLTDITLGLAACLLAFICLIPILKRIK